MNRAWLIVLLVGSPVLSLVAKEPTYTRWAIVSDSSIQQSGLSDFLMAKLSSSPNIQLVERDELDKIAKQWDLAAISSPEGSADRVSLGELVTADALVVLRRDKFGITRVVIADCRHGARLRVIKLGELIDADRSAVLLAEEIIRTQVRFAEGVEQIIGVTPFVSQNLGHRYDHLQTQWANVLAGALQTQPGVAVIELEEANAILSEIQLAETDASRTRVPMITKGVFRMTGQADHPKVDIGIEYSPGTEPTKRIVNSLPLNEVSSWVADELAKQLLAAADANTAWLPLSRQQATLIERADKFRDLGYWDVSSKLREAVLVVDPTAAVQRARLVEEHQQIFVPAMYAHWTESSPGQRRETLDALVNRYVVAQDHLEYLIRNKLISQSEAVELFRRQRYEGPGAYWGRTPYSTAAKTLAFTRMLDAERRFILEVFPLIHELPDEPLLSGLMTGSRFNFTAEFVLLERVVNHVYSRKYSPESLKLIEHAITKMTPSSTPSSFIVGSFIGDRLNESYFRDQQRADFDALKHRLANSNHSTAILYGLNGLYGRICHQDAKILALGEAVIREIAAKVDKVDAELGSSDRSGMLVRLRRIRLPLPPPLPSTPVPKYKTSMGRLVFEPIDLKTPVGLIRGVINCDDQFDLFWTPGSVYVMKEIGVLRRLPLKGPHGWPYTGPPSIAKNSQLIWDGELIWVCTAGFGIEVMHPKLPLAFVFNQENGLPACDNGIRIVPIAPRKILAVGSFGEHSRGWCAVVDVTGKPSVNVFHHATRVTPDIDSRDRQHLDPTNTFVPSWIHTFNSKDGRPTVLVGRWSALGYPLKIDLETLKVTTPDVQTNCWTNKSSYSRDGHLLQAATAWVSLFEAGADWNQGPKKLCRDRRHGSLYSHLAQYQGWLYVPGPIWHRINTQTFETERLGSEMLPHPFRVTHVAVSKHYGLVAHWAIPRPARSIVKSPVLWRVSVKDE